MIVVAEMCCEGYTHELINAGTVELAGYTFETDEVVYFAEKGQVNNVKRLTQNNKRYRYVICNHFHDVKCRIEQLQYYLNTNTGRIKLVILPGGICEGMERLIERFSDVIFLSYLHGAFEMIADNWKYIWNERSVDTLRGVWKCYGEWKDSKQNKERYCHDILYLSQYNNLLFACFNRNYRNVSFGSLEHIKQKIRLFFLPYIIDGLSEERLKGEVCRIGIASNPVSTCYLSCRAIIRETLKELGKYRNMVQFVTLNRLPKPPLPQTIREKTETDRNGEFTREGIDKWYRSLDYILIPYDSKRYVLTMSGCAVDAMTTCKPMILYSSPCFDTYDGYGVAIHDKDIHCLARKIAKVVVCKGTDQDKYDSRVRGIEEMNSYMKQYNTYMLRSIVL